jgi:hypothetical protein
MRCAFGGVARQYLPARAVSSTTNTPNRPNQRWIGPLITRIVRSQAPVTNSKARSALGGAEVFRSACIATFHDRRSHSLSSLPGHPEVQYGRTALRWNCGPIISFDGL